ADGSLRIGFDPERSGAQPDYYKSTYSYEGAEGIRRYFVDAGEFVKTRNLPAFMVGSHQSRFIVESIDQDAKTAQVFVVGWNTTDAESATRIPIIGYTAWYHEQGGSRINAMAGDSGPMSPVTQYFFFTATVSLD